MEAGNVYYTARASEATGMVRRSLRPGLEYFRTVEMMLRYLNIMDPRDERQRRLRRRRQRKQQQQHGGAGRREGEGDLSSAFAAVNNNNTNDTDFGTTTANENTGSGGNGGSATTATYSQKKRKKKRRITGDGAIHIHPIWVPRTFRWLQRSEQNTTSSSSSSNNNNNSNNNNIKINNHNNNNNNDEGEPSMKVVTMKTMWPAMVLNSYNSGERVRKKREEILVLRSIHVFLYPTNCRHPLVVSHPPSPQTPFHASLLPSLFPSLSLFSLCLPFTSRLFCCLHCTSKQVISSSTRHRWITAHRDREAVIAARAAASRIYITSSSSSSASSSSTSSSSSSSSSPPSSSSSSSSVNRYSSLSPCSPSSSSSSSSLSSFTTSYQGDGRVSRSQSAKAVRAGKATFQAYKKRSFDDFSLIAFFGAPSDLPVGLSLAPVAERRRNDGAQHQHGGGGGGRGGKNNKEIESSFSSLLLLQGNGTFVAPRPAVDGTQSQQGPSRRRRSSRMSTTTINGHHEQPRTSSSSSSSSSMTTSTREGGGRGGGEKIDKDLKGTTIISSLTSSPYSFYGVITHDDVVTWDIDGRDIVPPPSTAHRNRSSHRTMVELGTQLPEMNSASLQNMENWTCVHAQVRVHTDQTIIIVVITIIVIISMFFLFVPFMTLTTVFLSLSLSLSFSFLFFSYSLSFSFSLSPHQPHPPNSTSLWHGNHVSVTPRDFFLCAVLLLQHF